MLLFGKKVEIYAGKDEAQFEALKKLLRENNIRYGTGWTQSEIVGGCGELHAAAASVKVSAAHGLLKTIRSALFYAPVYHALIH